MREALARHGATHHFISTVDDIAWLFNLRGSDVSFNPVFLAHALLDASDATLFVADGKVNAELRATLSPTACTGAVRAGRRRARRAARQRGAADRPAPHHVQLARERERQGDRSHQPQHAAEEPQERRRGRARARADGAGRRGLCEFYAWFEAALARGERLTELTVDEHLSAARARRPGFVGLSFNTIAGFNANGAMPHYRATPESHAVIEGDGLLLIDSGGQYLGGTTDITRVWPIGTGQRRARSATTRWCSRARWR